MKLHEMVARDVWSRKRRVLYAALGVVVGTMTVIGILTMAKAGQEKILDQLEKYGPNLVVTPAIESMNAQLGSLNLGVMAVGENYINSDKIEVMRSIADTLLRDYNKITDNRRITAIAPKLYINTTLNGSSVMVVGIEPEEEWGVKLWWEVVEGKYIEGADEAVLGSMAASLLGLRPGDKITLGGHEFDVAGVLGDTASNEDYQVFVPISTLQAAFGKDGLLSAVDLRICCAKCPVVEVANAINDKVPGIRALAVKQVAASEQGMMDKMNGMMLSLAAITLVVGLFGVTNTMVSSVNERTKDIGIMRAVGASGGQIVKIFLYEALIIGIIGGIVGYLAGTALAYVLGPAIFQDIDVGFIPFYLPISIGLSTFVATLAVIYPSVRAARLKVADSFRSV